jgi:hypothetical protein
MKDNLCEGERMDEARAERIKRETEVQELQASIEKLVEDDRSGLMGPGPCVKDPFDPRTFGGMRTGLPFPVEVYRPQKGDVLVIEAERHLSQDQMLRIKRQAREVVGEHVKVMVIDKGLTLRVLREDEIERWESEGGRVKDA